MCGLLREIDKKVVEPRSDTVFLNSESRSCSACPTTLHWGTQHRTTCRNKKAWLTTARVLRCFREFLHCFALDSRSALPPTPPPPPLTIHKKSVRYWSWERSYHCHTLSANWIQEPATNIVISTHTSKHVVSIEMLNDVQLWNTFVYTSCSILEDCALDSLKKRITQSWFQRNWEWNFWNWGNEVWSQIQIMSTFATVRKSHSTSRLIEIRLWLPSSKLDVANPVHSMLV